MGPRLLLAAIVLGAAASAAAPAAAQQRRAPASVDWTRTVTATPEGGFRMGNPAAKVKVVEFGSLTCPHCADFAAGAKTPLTAAVRSGKVSFEYRNMVLNGIDIAATLVARCGGPSRFFPIVETLYRSQDQWVGRISGLNEAEKSRLKALPEGQMLVRMADVGGLVQIGARHGIPAAQARKCLADPAALDRLGKMYEAASALGVEGTPTFFINGRNVGVHSWATIEPLIRQAGG